MSKKHGTDEILCRQEPMPGDGAWILPSGESIPGYRAQVFVQAPLKCYVHIFVLFCCCYVHIGARAQAPNPGTKSGCSLGLGFGLGLGLSFGLVYAWTSKQNMNVDDLLSLVNEVPTNTYRHKFASMHISSITAINMQGFYASISITSLVFACLFSSVLHIF